MASRYLSTRWWRLVPIGHEENKNSDGESGFDEKFCQRFGKGGRGRWNEVSLGTLEWRIDFPWLEKISKWREENSLVDLLIFFFRVLVFEQVRREVLRFGCDIYNKYVVVPHVIWRLMTTLAPRDFTGIQCNYIFIYLYIFPYDTTKTYSWRRNYVWNRSL